MQTLERSATETRHNEERRLGKSNQRLRIAVAVLAVGVVALGVAMVLGNSSDDPMTATEAEGIFAEYGASLIGGDAERWIAQWTEDAVQLAPNAPANVGKAAILAGTEANMAVSTVGAFDISAEEVQSFGDFAYARGTYLATIQMNAGGGPFQIDGKFLTVFQRQPDGSWLIHRDVFNSNTPVPSGDGSPSPEDAVGQVVDAWNARDAEAMAALYDPEVVYIYDASLAGASWANLEVTGREALLEANQDTWAQWGPTVTSYEVLTVDGGTVTTSEEVQLSGGGLYRHAVTYEVSDNGLIIREEHIVQP
jgi:uncharacterized protein (TIGR02246 family)